MRLRRPSAERDRIDRGCRVAELILPYVFVASSGGEYYQVVSFSNELDNDDLYFLIQRQFETDDGGFSMLKAGNYHCAGTLGSEKRSSGELASAADHVPAG